MVSIFQSTFNPSFQKREVAWKLKEKSQKSTSSRIRWLFLHQTSEAAAKSGRKAGQDVSHAFYPWSLSRGLWCPAMSCIHRTGARPDTWFQSGPWNNFSVSSLGKTSQGPELLQVSAPLCCLVLGREQTCTQQGKRMDLCWPNPWPQSCHVIWDAQWLSCWQLLPSHHPGDSSRWEVAHRQLVPGGVRLWIGITPLKSRRCWLQRTMQCRKNLLRGPEANCLGVRSPDKKAKEAFEPRKGLNGFTGSKEKPGRNKEKKKYTVLVSSAHWYSREKKYDLQWTGKGFFFESVKGKKYIVHTYFMLSNTPVWERNSNTDFCILKEKETGAVGRLLQPQAGAGETVLSGYFVSGHLLSCSIWVKADCIMAMLFRNHQTAQILISAAVLHVLMDAIQVASLFLLWSLYFLKNN